VAVGEQRDQQPVQQMLLTDDDARHLHLQRPNPPELSRTVSRAARRAASDSTGIGRDSWMAAGF